MTARRWIQWLPVAAFPLLLTMAWPQTGDDDVILRAMRDELERSRSLKLAGLDPPYGRWLAWAERPGPHSLESLARRTSTRPPPRPAVEARFTVLTSGTTGAPKGASRGAPAGGALAAVGGLLGRVPLHTGQTMQICAPMFHSLGLATMLLLRRGSQAMSP